MRQGYPHKELTSQDNLELLGTYTRPGWGSLAEAMKWAKFWRIPAMENAVKFAMRTSGNIEGDHRHDIRDGISGVNPAKASLGMGASDE